MTLHKGALALILAARLFAANVPDPAQQPAPPAQTEPAGKVKKAGSKKKWIILGAVAASVGVALALTAKRLGNEGVGIFR